jgi:hypothetical protein
MTPAQSESTSPAGGAALIITEARCAPLSHAGRAPHSALLAGDVAAEAFADRS